MEIKLVLPWPPSWNKLYRISGSRMYKTRAAKDFATEVQVAVRRYRFDGFGTARIELDIQAWPPDKRRRDLDNIQKILLDSMQMAKLYKDDSQVDRISIVRGPVMPGGMVHVTIKEKK